MEPRLFDLDFQLLSDSCLTLLAVFVLVIVASNLLFNPVREFLKKRREGIKSDLESAAKDKAEAKALKEEYEKKLAEINREADQILSEARKKASDAAKRTEADARAEANGIIAQAKKEAELEKQKAVHEVRQQMIDIASIMAGKVVSASIDTRIQDSLVDETLKEMGESVWLS